MAAAVADFRPVAVAEHKIKKDDDRRSARADRARAHGRRPRRARRAPRRRRPAQVVVGFAAETGDDDGSVLDHGRAKLARKGCDLLVVNEVGEGKAFESDDNEVVVLGADGSADRRARARASTVVADAVWDAVVPLLHA